MPQLDGQVTETNESVEVPRVGLKHGQVGAFRGLVSTLEVEGAGSFEQPIGIASRQRSNLTRRAVARHTRDGFRPSPQ